MRSCYTTSIIFLLIYQNTKQSKYLGLLAHCTNVH